MKRQLLTSVFVTVFTMSQALAEENTPNASQTEFFEAKIRPVLVESCYGCHNSSDTAEGDLVLDHRTGLRRGGQSGPPIDLKEPSKSLLLRVLRHEVAGLEMPEGADRLSDETIADFEKWLGMGAPDPRATSPKPTDGGGSVTWEQTLQQRMEWWSFQPIVPQEIPEVKDQHWSPQAIDRFILAKLEAAGLEPAGQADRRTLIRRLSFVLRGLPPTVEEINRFLQDDDSKAYEQLVDRFLNSPAFGEQWARHWMDLVRYSETHGSEGDPAIPSAWKYRDYLIRALNADVPYDQLIRENLAGDLLTEPRVNLEAGINESAIGPAQWRMCYHGFAPTDALDEKVRFTDDQINVVSKAFLGMSVSCARCHNHKFDPISQADYYAMFGIVGSARPGIVDVNTTDVQSHQKKELEALKSGVRHLLAEDWLTSLSEQKSQLENLIDNLPEAAKESRHLLHPFHLLSSNKSDFANLSKSKPPASAPFPEAARHWELSNPQDLGEWFVHGNGTADKSSRPGEFTVGASDTAIGQLLPGGAYSHLLSTKHRNVLSSADFPLNGKYELWLQIAGEGEAIVRYVVQDYPRNGTVYPFTTLNKGEWRWQMYNLDYWDGDQIHIELATAADSAVLAKNIERSWFGVQQVVVAPKGSFQPPVEKPAYSQLLSGPTQVLPASLNELKDRYLDELQSAISAWMQQRATNSQVQLLQAFRDLQVVETSPRAQAQLTQLIKRYQQLEREIALPQRVPGVLEADARDQAIFVRGNHKQASALVPRRFLEAIDSTPYETQNSGRLRLAEDFTRADNPLTSRVFVNRLWHWVFGAGLVRTVDNFGQLGELPSHPELLDFLATAAREKQWSTKAMIRELLLSKTWQLDSQSSSEATRIDPDNRLLSHANVRRLSGEELRDSLLTVSGKLDRRLFGPPVGNATNHPRRSLYLQVRRNTLNPFLKAFDFPVPFATKGRRDATNVPAQSLVLLNDPFVASSADNFAKLIAQSESSNDRSTKLFEAAIGRLPNRTETEAMQAYVDALSKRYAEDAATRGNLQQSLNNYHQQVDSILGPVRDQLVARRGAGADLHAVPNLVAEWRFEESFNDEIGKLHGIPIGEPTLIDGALVLTGKNYVKTPPLPIELTEKTLEAIVQLSDLNQRGGGVMTVQDLSGTFFDSIVYGEQAAKHWLSGSNNFQRTLPFGGDAEAEALDHPVHLAITYAKDGTIRAYRNGVHYGQSIRKSDTYLFKAEAAQVLFGLRHGTPGGNRMLTGKIFEARLYNRELAADEVQALASGKTAFVSQRDVLAALTASQTAEFDALQTRIQNLEVKLEQLGVAPTPDQPWSDLAHAIFNLKEFLYYR